MKTHQIWACALTLAAAASVSYGAVIQFDPDGTAPGNGTLSVGSFAMVPGNSIAVGGLTNTASFTQLYQARVGNLLDGNGNILTVPGLNSTFELTAIVGYQAAGTSSGNTISASLKPGTSGTSFIDIYYNSSVKASDLNGTNFNTGTLIYSGTLTYASSVFMVDTTQAASALDQFNTANWLGEQSVTGIGGLAVVASTGFTDPDFFKSNMTGSSISANTSTALPYKETDPSHSFVNIGGSAYTPSIGAVNGQSGPDILIQADANAAFTLAPEPASLALLGLGALGLLARRRH
jgi:hypothetical protein